MILGIVFSSLGLHKQPKGLSIAGLVISIVSFILAIIVIIAIGHLMTSLEGGLLSH